MMGKSHALSGACIWAGAAAAAPYIGHARPAWGSVAIGLFAAAGAALLADADHDDATIAHTFGSVSKALTRYVHRVSGGHRHATHSLLFAALCPLLAWICVAIAGRYAAQAMVFVLSAFAIRALHLARGAVSSTAGIVATLSGLLLHGDYGWLPWSIACGTVAHLAGDCLTKEGCPLLWPKPRHYKLPVIQRTGNRLETRVFAPLFGIGTIALLALTR